MARVALKNIKKAFKSNQALKNIEFETRDGELFCLLGPSGAGKTTSLRIIAGIETPDSGDVFMDEEKVGDLLPRDRDVAFAFESYALYPQYTVYKNLAFPLNAPIRKQQLSEQQINDRVLEVAQMLGISDLLTRLPRELSGGQRQRVGLGRALVRRPKVYLLDEPIAHLDAKLRHRMRGELKKIQADLGITTIYSTPDQLEALSMADTIAVINLGMIEQVGTPDDLFNRPCNTFVAKLVGDPPMNFLDANLVEGKMLIDSGANIELTIPAGFATADADRTEQGKVIVGIRPKDIEVVPDTAPGCVARGKVREVDILGQTAVALVEVGKLVLKVKTSTTDAPPKESLVSLAMNTSQLHYFDPGTTRRIG